MEYKIREVMSKHTKKLAAKIYTLIEATFTDPEQRNASKRIFAKEIYETFGDLEQDVLELLIEG